ncbi:MAG TPA: M4 family metallopeptidase [Labilithrix sp.]|nr:M4 family metallopeptidase [Labilithrix sp.]
MRKLGFVALAIAAAGCSSDPSTGSSAQAPSLADPGVTASQLRAYDALQLETSRPWTWMQHETLRTPMHLSASRTGKPLLVDGVSAEKATVAFVGQYKELFKMRDAQAELSLAKSEVDQLAMTHVRFQQVHRGIPVTGAELAAHYDAAGRITSIDANYVSGIDIEVNPQIAASVGQAAARADILASTPVADESKLEMSEGKLVVYAQDHAPTLAYEYRTRAIFGSAPAIWVTTVDAKTGEIIDRYNNLQTVEASGAGVLGDAKKFQVSTAGAGYVMTDGSRGVAINTYSAKGQEVGPGQGATAVTSTTLTSWDTGTGAGAAVDAHTYAGAVFDYYKKVHGRNAIDGAGGAMLSTAHFGQAYDNAFWDGNGMSYGDGGQMFKPLSAGLDVVAHEFTHGVTEKTSALVYKAQSGALNESVSDIFGVFIEHSLQPNPVKNWTMGENIALQAGVLRDFKNPAAGQQPAAMSQYVNTQQDEGGVHTNSGIPNNAAYLMTMGGTNPATKTVVKFGIGFEKSEKLWYRANTKYFLSTTNFAQAAQATMSAAKDVGLTANEQNIVDCAWKATGVVQGACSPLTDPTVPSVPSAPTGEEPTGNPTTTPGTDGTDPAADETETPAAPAKKKRTTLTPQDSSGCSVGASGSTDVGPLAGLLAVVVGLTLSRRKRR